MACFSLGMEPVIEYGSGHNQLPRPDVSCHVISYNIFIIMYFLC